MAIEQGVIWLAAACGVVLMIAGWQKKKEVMKNFVLRLIIGAILISGINYGLASADIGVEVGLNPVSLVAAGALGVPGVAMLYGIAGCKYL